MLITASKEYVCLAMLELAARYRDPKPVPISEIADKHNISRSFLVQILLKLKTHGLVHTTRGSSGGYQLAKPPEKITLADIFTVLDRIEEPEEPRTTTSSLGRKLVEVWKGLADTQTRFLKGFTLRDLLPPEVEVDY